MERISLKNVSVGPWRKEVRKGTLYLSFVGEGGGERKRVFFSASSVQRRGEKRKRKGRITISITTSLEEEGKKRGKKRKGEGGERFLVEFIKR